MFPDFVAVVPALRHFIVRMRGVIVMMGMMWFHVDFVVLVWRVT
jgi:hypothetical protein